MKTEKRIPYNLKEQIAFYGIKPSDIVFYINSVCNLRCKHCYIGNDLLNQNNFFNLSDSINFLNSFHELDRLTILGGEPLMYNNFDILINSLHSDKIKELRITTNLTDSSVLEKISPLIKKNIRLCISLDGHNSEIHDFIRGKGAFKKTTTNLREVLKMGFDIEVTHTLMTINIQHFKKFIELCKEIGITNINLHKMSLQGNALSNRDLYITPSTYVNFCSSLREMNDQIHGSTNIRFPLLYATEEEYKVLSHNKNYKPHAMKSYYGDEQRIVLYPTGQVFISSEFFGTESYIGNFDNEKFYFNDNPKNELLHFKELDAEITDLNPNQIGDSIYTKVLSVSFKDSVRV
jgi:MoaA/NifB/PqqE/SkfB family radical SAM enzyme